MMQVSRRASTPTSVIVDDLSPSTTITEMGVLAEIRSASVSVTALVQRLALVASNTESTTTSASVDAPPIKQHNGIH